MGRRHIALDLLLCDERRDRVDNDYVNSTGSYKRLGNIERLLAARRLRNEKPVYIDAERLRVYRVESVLDVDISRLAAGLLGFRDDVQRDGRLTG